MKVTRKKAIELCIELWTWLAKTGSKNKKDWPGWKKYKICSVWDCFFCDYAMKKAETGLSDEACSYCPLWDNKKNEAIRSCVRNYAYGKWVEARQIRTRKKYAKLFLEQIRGIE
jgi:hypothetical protein